MRLSWGKDAARLHEMLCSWHQAAATLKAGEISQEDYDRWCYRYPEFSNAPGHVKPISQGLSDMLVDALKEQSEE